MNAAHAVAVKVAAELVVVFALVVLPVVVGAIAHHSAGPLAGIALFVVAEVGALLALRTWPALQTRTCRNGPPHREGHV